MSSKLNWFVWALTIVVATIHLVWWYPQLPDIVPAHFNGSGQVDSEMTKSGFCLLIAGIQLMTLVGLPLLGSILKQLPDSLVNMPNREYWLAPERREASLAVNYQMLLATAWLTGVLMMVIFELSAQVAMKRRTGIHPEMWIALAVYLVLVFGMCGWSFYWFRLPEKAQAS